MSSSVLQCRRRFKTIAEVLLTVFFLVAVDACAEPQRAAAPVAAAARPADVVMNPDAGKSQWLFVTLRMEDGTELPFFVDTGATVSCVDKSLAPKLGARLATFKGKHYDDIVEGGMYATPKLYLGGVPLETGGMIAALDLADPASKAGRPIMGILGMDCLRHYCIQLDFEAERMRFLDPGSAEAAWGEAIPVTFPHGVSFVHRRGLMEGTAEEVLIDTGNVHDGDVELAFFREKVRERVLLVKADRVDGKEPRKAWLPRCEWDGAEYTSLQMGSGVNSIGLRFLARHLVTLNFPKQVMYLKRTSTGPLRDENAEGAAAFLRELGAQGGLAGWPEKNGDAIAYEAHPDFRTFEFRKEGNACVYHYSVIRSEKDGGWKLRKVWRTDESGRVVAEYSVPGRKGSRVAQRPDDGLERSRAYSVNAINFE
jgi:hypothetical protein